VSDREAQFRDRVATARDGADIVAIVGAAVKLRGGRHPRGQCPFHGSKSDSLAVYPDRGTARCWGCGWGGDAIKFIQDFYGLPFLDALAQVDGGSAGAGLAAQPVQRARAPVRRRNDAPVIAPVDLGRWLWRHARPDPAAARTYFAARGVPCEILSEARLANIRFIALGPIACWREDRGPESVPQAPALVALVRSAPGGMNPPWQPQGVHVTFLAPGLTAKMDRRRGDGEKYPARKMLGPMAGGCVLLPGLTSAPDMLDPACPLFDGEGIETVLSGMALAGAGAEASAIAALSLDSLQGRAKLIRDALPLHDPEPDPERGRAIAFAHDGPVTVLVDADMKPIRGPIDRKTGAPVGVPVIEARRAPIIRRAITGAERAAVCAVLSVKAWRAAGARQVRAVRPRMGQDFNDAVREGQG
jgi:DNA primase